MIKYLSRAKLPKNARVVLLRLDFNTEDEWRMRAAIPTLKFLLAKKLTVVVASHRGRPKGFDKKLSLRKDARELRNMIRKPVHFIPRFNFAEIEKTVRIAKPGSVFLLENLRFLTGEDKDSRQLARALARLADAYVDDAFAVAHRAEASIDAVTKIMPSYAGLELEREITFMSHATRDPKHPVVVIVGGAKAHDKLGVLKNFKKKADVFLLGGGPANTLLYLRGKDVGASVRDTDPKDLVNLRKALTYRKIILPVDFRVSGGAILDIGPQTAKLFAAKIASARTIIWSGPMGLIEKKKYEKGNLAVARAVIKNRRAFSLTGGGETVMFLKKHKLDKQFTFISTGGGAMLDFLAGKKLPGIEALKRSEQS